MPGNKLLRSVRQYQEGLYSDLPELGRSRFVPHEASPLAGRPKPGGLIGVSTSRQQSLRYSTHAVAPIAVVRNGRHWMNLEAAVMTGPYPMSYGLPMRAIAAADDGRRVEQLNREVSLARIDIRKRSMVPGVARTPRLSKMTVALGMSIRASGGARE